MWRFGIGAANTKTKFYPPSKKLKLDSTEKRKLINYTRSTSVNVLLSNLGQVGVRGYVMKRQ